MTTPSEARRLPWRRIIAEGLAIVASILLAFAIDAWWGRVNQASAEQALLVRGTAI
jgi:hypothetical protein